MTEFEYLVEVAAPVWERTCWPEIRDPLNTQSAELIIDLLCNAVSDVVWSQCCDGVIEVL